VYNLGAFWGGWAKTEIARAYGRKKLGSQVARGFVRVLGRKAGIAGGTKQANSGAGTREPWHIPVRLMSGCILMKSKYLLVVAVAKPNRRCL
jgi:hypothetical protein